MCACTCLNFMDQAVADPIVDAAIPFIEAYTKSPDWHRWEAVLMALVYPRWSRPKHPDAS
ncbi:hypothetical protein PISMIDRAFT_674832 [Pisolithus microcarpus 441]|uniref:Uncharacterized protein n=1 Tax=Pisolithus microcarpus 441 TaxID=765257 RepID=A0A0C9ZNH1_9AGAM|nr:hypothetical protein BKA83DRAFT_674832 [Pisolithus microcarpus]KIK27474.1 hypothetical protein PISMIDRAFT_674832 [Pisolithus microcarpus 441]